jgi:hypothetical protein
MSSHLEEEQLGYFEHAAQALGYAWTSLVTSVVLVCHAVCPDAFVRTGSQRTHDLYKQMRRLRFTTKNRDIEMEIVD